MPPSEEGAVVVVTRLVVWNILEGFHQAGTSIPDDARIAAARAVLADLAPDVLVLNEALWCEPHGGRHVDYAGLLGFRWSAASLYDGAWGNAVLSRLPIAASSRFRIYNRGGLRADVVTPGGTVRVATYHPHPSRLPANKAADFLALVSGWDGPLIACGDFNAINPDDAPDRAALHRAFGRFSARPAQDADRFVDGGAAVFPALSGAGLADAVPTAGRRHTIPTDLASRDKASAMRIDHVLANRLVAVSGGEVVRHPAAEAASDHYPVLIDFAVARD